MTKNPNPTSGPAEFSNGHAERSNKFSLRARVWSLMPVLRDLVLFLRAWAWNLILKARLSLEQLVSLAFARVLMSFVVGVAVGIAWQSYGSEVRKTIANWSPHLAWLAPAAAPAGTSAERLKATSLALAATRQSFDKLTTEISKLQAQDIPDARPGSRRTSQR
jgi:hypothetical protein